MDRILKVYAKTGHLFAEFDFYYEYPQTAKVRYTEYRRLYNDDEEDENKSVYPGMESDRHLSYTRFSSIDQAKAHDREVVIKEMGREMKDKPEQYTYVYSNDQVLQRYVAENHLGCIGIINIRYCFVDNMKEVRFLSADNPRFDIDLASNGLETNIDCIRRIPVNRDRQEPGELHPNDLKKLEPWY